LLQLQRDDAYNKLEQLKRELEERNLELARLSTVDGLTGIANRRSFDTTLDREWRRALREKGELSLILTDIDFFKRYNDSYGHPAGDECLRQVARCLAESIRRPTDLAARYGGEEFALLLPGTNLAGAATLAETVRERVAALGLEHRGSDVAPHVTLSLGIASCHPGQGHQQEELIRLADQALYAAKRGGRNQFSVAR
jgi:two-component system chemotaxis family response regulator WspR